MATKVKRKPSEGVTIQGCNIEVENKGNAEVVGAVTALAQASEAHAEALRAAADALRASANGSSATGIQIVS